MSFEPPRFGRRLFTSSLALPLLASGEAAASAGDDPIARMSTGAILRDPRGDAHPLGRAMGLVDAPVGEVLRVLLDFERYAELLSLNEVSLRSRSYGRAGLRARGRFFAVGSFEAELDVTIEGHEDGKHAIVARRISGTLPRLDAGFSLERSPSGTRSILSVELGIDAPGILPNRMVAERCTDGAVVSVARVRRLVREARTREAEARQGEVHASRTQR